MSRRRRKQNHPDQFDLFEPPHERCEDGRGSYLQFLIAPPSELKLSAQSEAPVVEMDPPTGRNEPRGRSS